MKSEGTGTELSTHRQFSLLLDNLPSMVAYLDRDLRFQYGNKAFATWCGFSPEELKEKVLYEVFAPDVFAQVEPFVGDVLAGQNTDLEIEVLREGLFKYWHVELSFLPLNDGLKQGFIFHANDITSKIMAERELRDYVDNASIGMHWVNADGIIIWANATELNMLGYEKEEYIGHHIAEFHADPLTIADILARLANNETLNNYEARLKCKDGSFRYVSVNSNVLWEENKFVKTRCFSADITTKKKLADSLKREEAKFRTLLNSLPVAVYTCNKEGEITYFNDSAEKLWGHKPKMNAEAVKFCAAYKVWMDGVFIPPEETPMAIAINTGQSFRNLQPVFERPDGTAFTAHVTISPLYDEDNNLNGAINVFQDITDLKEAQDALRESEFQHKQVLELLPAAVYTCDELGRVQLFNEAAATLWGRKPEIGKDKWCGSWKIFDPEDGSPVPLDTCPMSVCLHEGRAIYGTEIIVERPDGSRRNVAPNPRPIFDSHGKIIGAVNMLLDITDRKDSERIIRESEKRFRMMADLVPIVIWLTDENGKCSYVNPFWSELTGVEIQQALGNGWRQFVHPDEQSTIENEFQSATAERRVIDLKFRYLNANSSYGTHHVFAEPRYDDNHQYLGHIGILQDITRQEEIQSFLEEQVKARTEELREKNVALEKVNQDLASFTYISSHDLQEPLRKIQMFTSRILELDADAFSPKSKDYFDRITGAAIRMRALIDDLLTYSHANTSQRKFENKDLNELVQQVMLELKESIEEKHGVLEVHTLPTLNIIPFQFQQLIINIISNALKFSKPDVNPVISIRADVVAGNAIMDLNADKNKNYHHLTFTDNGIGFSPDYNAKIFEVFQRLHSRNDYHGTGVGLAICKKIMENHNGIIVAEGKLNVGATFHVYLPVD